VSRLSSQDARSAGIAVALLAHSTISGLLVEAGLPPGLSAARLLAVAPGAGSLAMAGSRSGQPEGLLLAMIDGSQLWVRLPGASAAVYSPAGDRLLVIDGAGSAWQVDPVTGGATLLAEGPFTGRPVFAPDGAVLFLAVSSVEAPITSQLVRLDPVTGVLTSVSESQLVYGAFPMADGTIAIAAHAPGGTLVDRINDEEETQVADLGPDAANVVVAPDGTIAFERRGLGVFLVGPAEVGAHHLVDGDHPIFSPDGSALLVASGGRTLLVALDGSILGRYGPQAAFASCPAGCAS
jgi:hypothetical protein